MCKNKRSKITSSKANKGFTRKNPKDLVTFDRKQNCKKLEMKENKIMDQTMDYDH